MNTITNYLNDHTIDYSMISGKCHINMTKVSAADKANIDQLVSQSGLPESISFIVG